jgi:hypothetical protein
LSYATEETGFGCTSAESASEDEEGIDCGQQSQARWLASGVGTLGVVAKMLGGKGSPLQY